ncbi:MAG TPA: hypothetical protein PLX45_12150 [Piscinibacter sp.]|nr:hypothetical protein [Piscinibacter sp.]HPM67001.1 hypothetical protein [Piscinibacter sp.]
MTSILDSSTTRQKTGKPMTRDASSLNARIEPIDTPSKITVRTLLVASCGWPTDAPAPERKKIAKR